MEKLTWKRESGPKCGTSYLAIKGPAIFEIFKDTYLNCWSANVYIPGMPMYKHWQNTKTLKAAKLACEDYAHYNL